MGSIFLLLCRVFAGDVSGYLLGLFNGDVVLRKSNWAKREYDRHHDRMVQYQKRWSVWIVIIGRFLPFIRAVTPFAMGIGGMKLSRFLAAAASGSLA